MYKKFDSNTFKSTYTYATFRAQQIITSMILDFSKLEIVVALGGVEEINGDVEVITHTRTGTYEGLLHRDLKISDR